MQDVGLIMTLMDKAVRQHALYGPKHPIAGSALQSLEGKLRDYFAEADRLEIIVKRTELEWNGQTIFTLEKQEGNYVQEMYIDGVRQLEIHPSVTQKELVDLISVFSRDVHEYEVREDDSVTLLWKKGFQNIRYQTIDVYAGELNALLREQMPEEQTSDSQREEKNYLDEFIGQLLETDPGKGMAPPTSPPTSQAADAADPLPLTRFQAIEEESEALRIKAAQMMKRDRREEVAVIFAEVLEQERDSATLKTLIDSYLSILKKQLLSGELRPASNWLKRLRGIQTYLANQDPEFHALIDTSILEQLSADLFAELGKKLEEGIGATPDDWIHFFRYLGPTTAPAVCEVLTHIPQETLHSKLVEFLVTYAPDRPDIFVEHLKNPSWMVVRDMVRILGQILDESHIEAALQRVAAHPKAEIRQEIVYAIGRFSGEATHQILHRALGDADTQVRDAAIRQIARTCDPFFSRPLAEFISGENFTERDLAEKKRTMVALARCGGASTLDFLEQILRNAGSGELQQELRLAALHGIAEVADPHADEILTELAKKKFTNRSLRETAEQLSQRRNSPRPEEENV